MGSLLCYNSRHMELRWWMWVRGLPRRLPFLTATSFVVATSCALLVLIEYLTRVRFAPPAAVSYVLSWATLTLTFGALVLLPWQRYLIDRERLYVEAFLTGSLIGLISALAKLLFHFELWASFNILAEPIRTGLFGLLVAWVVCERHRAVQLRLIV